MALRPTEGGLLFGPKLFHLGSAKLGNFGPLGYGHIADARMGNIGLLHYGEIGGLYGNSFLGASNPYANDEPPAGTRLSAAAVGVAQHDQQPSIPFGDSTSPESAYSGGEQHNAAAGFDVGEQPPMAAYYAPAAEMRHYDRPEQQADGFRQAQPQLMAANEMMWMEPQRPQYHQEVGDRNVIENDRVD